MPVESAFQKTLIEDIKTLLPGSIVLKNDPNYIQGIPDLIVVHGSSWAALECKRNAKAKHQPNQDYYVDKMNNMSYAAFVYPENKQEVLDALQQAFGVDR